jgi:hypothetical protein
MSTLEQINKIEIQINNLRLDLIRIIAEINRTIASGKRTTRSQEYIELKYNYQCKREEIHYLRGLIREMSGNSQAA